MNQYYDVNRRPIRQGDLLRTPHFRDRRRRQFYLYHVVTLIDGRLWMIPASELDERSRIRGKGTGRTPLNDAQVSVAEIIDGYGEAGCDFWADRPRRRPNSVTAEAKP